MRALGFIDDATGVMGNIGTDAFPGVTDTTPLYRTRDGGVSWQAAAIRGPAPKGICAIDVLRVPYINAGTLDHRIVLHAAGRVGGPAFLLRSDDGGASWSSRDMGARTAMVLDVHFVDARTGFIAGASDADVEKSRGLILKTSDGGVTWREVWRSTRDWETTWKMSWPDAATGYVSLQSYDPDPANVARFVVKSRDGGDTWQELPVVEDHGWRAFGIGFASPARGWIGGSTTGCKTRDGGRSWRKVDFGQAVNKIRIVGSGRNRAIYALGKSLYKLELGD